MSGPGIMLGRSAALARNWWALEWRGLFAILFGIIALAWPGVTIGSLVLVFGVYMLVDGAFALVGAIRAATHHGRWAGLILEGLIDLLVGLIALAMPVATVLAFVWLAAAWAVVSGFALLWAGFGLHPTHGRWLLILGAVISIVWGVLLFLLPAAGAVVLTWWLGAYALLFGIALIIAGLRLRRMHRA
jgi:uncharacterized membrane protein HdeD (DUF308 family)